MCTVFMFRVVFIVLYGSSSLNDVYWCHCYILQQREWRQEVLLDSIKKRYMKFSINK